MAVIMSQLSIFPTIKYTLHCFWNTSSKINSFISELNFFIAVTIQKCEEHRVLFSSI